MSSSSQDPHRIPGRTPSNNRRKLLRFIGDYRLVYRTTWKFRLAMVLILFLLTAVTRGLWGPAMGRSLVCGGNLSRSQAVIIANYDVEYLLFKRAGELQKRGLGDQVIIPLRCSKNDPRTPNPADKAVAVALSRLAEIRDPLYLSVSEKEPISYHVTREVGEILQSRGIRSMILVTQGFRSRRDLLIHQKVLSGKGIKIYCDPVFGPKTPENWMDSWHGIQEVFLQIGKLLYYRLKLLFLD